MLRNIFGQKNNKVDFWIKREKLIDRLYKLYKPKTTFENDIKDNISSRTRAFIKVQDGCDNYCSYCIVPFLRGKPKTRSINSLIREIKKREKEGYKEIVLVGTDLRKVINQKLKIKGLTSLLKVILEKTSIPRIRISSLWPTAITPELIDLIKKEPRICPHLHLSVQSGCEKTLKKMGRGYKIKRIIKLIKELKKIPNLNLTADIIVGFPGEREKDFQATANFVKKAKFLKVHIFRYSPRPGTLAAQMPNQISEKIKKERSKKLNAICQKISKEVKTKYLNKIFPVLIENKKDNLWSGYTPNYLRVYLKNLSDLENQIVDVKLLRLYKDGFFAKIINN
ncbi:MAG: MiaB/RimO family radical SAM methylthiotransferase [Endomicrobiia bacterium]